MDSTTRCLSGAPRGIPVSSGEVEGSTGYSWTAALRRKRSSSVSPTVRSTWRSLLSKGRKFQGRSSRASQGVHGLRSYPQQVIHHGTFPRLIGGHKQVTWLSINVPPSGRAADLATDLMREWDRVTGGNRFATDLTKDRRDGMKMLDSWRQVATSHFLGVLHLDEVQNLFKLSTLKSRRNKSEVQELSIVEDQFLKWILILMNTWHVPLLISGTCFHCRGFEVHGPLLGCPRFLLMVVMLNGGGRIR